VEIAFAFFRGLGKRGRYPQLSRLGYADHEYDSLGSWNSRFSGLLSDREESAEPALKRMAARPAALVIPGVRTGAAIGEARPFARSCTLPADSSQSFARGHPTSSRFRFAMSKDAAIVLVCCIGSYVALICVSVVARADYICHNQGGGGEQ